MKKLLLAAAALAAMAAPASPRPAVGDGQK
jgi:hypothetical protein